MSTGHEGSPERPSSHRLWPALLVSCLLVTSGIWLLFPVGKTPLATESPSSAPTQSAAPAPQTAPLPLVACGGGNDSSVGWAGRTLCNSVDRATHGRLKLTYAPHGTLQGQQYDELSLIHEVQSGHVAMAIVSGAPLSNVDPDYEIFDLPFLFKVDADMDRALDGPLGNKLLSGLESCDLKGLGFLDLGYRIFATSTPMPTLADFKNKRLRVMQTAAGISMAHLMGCEPVPAPAGRSVRMSKNGYIDAADRTFAGASRSYETSPYITETHHTHSVKVLLANRRWFSKLPEDCQSAMIAALPDIEKEQRERQRAENDRARQQCVAHGVKIFVLPPEERERFHQLCQPIYGEFERLRGPSLLEEVHRAQASSAP